MKDNVTVFIGRLAKINVNVTLAGNYPWVYLSSVNGIKVKETYLSNHGFTAGFLQKEFKFIDLKILFKTIRKYRDEFRKCV